MSDPTQAQYGTEIENVPVPTTGQPPKLHENAPGPGLPFTGLDVAALLIVAAALSLFGLLLRRVT